MAKRERFWRIVHPPLADADGVVLFNRLLPSAARPPKDFAREPLTLWRRLRQKAFIWGLGADANTRAALRCERAPVDEAGLVHLRMRGLEPEVLARPGPVNDDRATVWEIFFHRPYDGHLPYNYRTVLDLGANIGLTLAYLLKRNTPIEKYVGVEPDPATFDVLNRQVASLGMANRSYLFNVAASNRHGRMRFNTDGQSFLHKLGEAGDIEVETRRVGELLDEAGVSEVDFMKLDIEGGEREVMDDAASWAPRVRRIAAELHFEMDAAWLRSRLEPLGFRVFPAGRLFRETVGAVREDVAHELPEHLR